MFYDIAKRTIDIIMAVILLIIFSPVFLIAPILIKLDTPGPVFVEESRRVGKNRKLFYMYKFRTMIANARELLRTNPQFRRLYQDYKKQSYKLKDDPRITRVGKFLRRFSLDELPQVFNILRGQMSLVGPRAYYPDELKNQQRVYPKTKRYMNDIFKIKPGITGYWQVTGRSEVNFDKRVKMDAEYARRRSIPFDMMIIIKTPWIMISGKGAM